MFCKLITVSYFRKIGSFALAQQRFSFHACFYSTFSVKMSHENRVYVRIKDRADDFKLLFAYRGGDSKPDKEFYFQRRLVEPVKVLLNRISLKINAITRKKHKKNKNQFLLENEPPVTVQLMKNGISVPEDTACEDVFRADENSDIILKIGELRFRVNINQPWIQKIKLPSSIMVGYAVYPSKLEGYFMDEDESKFMWFRGSSVDGNRNDSEMIASGIIYFPKIEDVGYHLRLICTPVKNGIEGLSVEIQSPQVVQAGPGPCPFEDRHVFTNKSLTNDSFRVVSYNILADLYASSAEGKAKLFSYCEEYWLSINYRKQLLLKELLGYNADIVCLQEVDCKVFENDLKRVLRIAGMEGVLTKKGGQVNEGIACFYNGSRFRLLSTHTLSLGEDARSKAYLNEIWNVIDKNESLADKMKCRTTAVQVLLFDYVDKAKHKVVVANTHLYFHPEADHIRLLQAGMCLKLIDEILDDLKSQESDTTFSVIFCGDFNSTPECGIFKLFTTNHIPENYQEWNSGDGIVEGLSLRNTINFESACGVPEFTNYTEGFKACLDYIFYQTDFLEVRQVIPFPLEEELSRYKAIPSVVFPSDHVALVVDLAWK